MWMSDLELTSSSRTDLKLAQFSVLTCLSQRQLSRLCVFRDNAATWTPCNWGLWGWLPWLPTSQQSRSSSIVALVFSVSQLPIGLQGAWKLLGSFCAPYFHHGFGIWDLQCKALGSLQTQLPAQKARNQLQWDFSCHKGPGIVLKLTWKSTSQDFMLFSFKPCIRCL